MNLDEVNRLASISEVYNKNINNVRTAIKWCIANTDMSLEAIAQKFYVDSKYVRSMNYRHGIRVNKHHKVDENAIFNTIVSEFEEGHYPKYKPIPSRDDFRARWGISIYHMQNIFERLKKEGYVGGRQGQRTYSIYGGKK